MKTLPSPQPEKPTILIVDDTPVNVAMLAEYLLGHGFVVMVAQDGEEGIERANFVHPDIILLDVVMPGIGGFEICRRLKSKEDTQDIPVIFMTALADIDDKITGYKLGGVDYVTKPFHTDEVLARVNTHLSLRTMQRQLLGKTLQLQQEIAVRVRAEADLLSRNTMLTELNEKLSQAQEQLLLSEKLASIGQLAAGVAHEINNPIGYISSNIYTLDRYMAKMLNMLSVYRDAQEFIAAPDVVARLDSMRNEEEIDYLIGDCSALLGETKEGIDRVRKIVQDLKDFSRADDNSNWHWADLHKGIDSTLNIISSEIKFMADVLKEYGDIPEVECLSSQINQVIMNLVVNAAHATGTVRGTITVRTGREGKYAWIEVADTGCGIPPENLSRIFDPFYTTKPVGKGTGLGLALSYGIVQRHHGRIDVSSVVGQGSTFRVTLPIKHEEPNENSSAIAA